MDKKSLVPVSIDYLYDGMVLPQDIYDATAKRLLLRRGSDVSESKIDTIRRANGGKNTIRVSVETQKMLLEHLLSCEIVGQAELEEETGYTEVKDETLTMLKEIEYTHIVPPDRLHMVSEALSDRVGVTSPDLIIGMVNSLAPVDEYLQRHSINVSLLNGLIGNWMGLNKEIVDLLVLVGLLHDCGKTSIPPQILDAPRRLTVTEFEIVKMHPVYSHELLSEFPEIVRSGVRDHHEKCNGKGYPGGIFMKDIPLAARVTTVSDIYDAMISRRAYKESKNPFSIMAWLHELRGIELDPLIVDIFIQNMPKELINKPVSLSNGEVGVIHEIDLDDIEYPYIRTGNNVIKSSERLFCTSMYYEEEAASVQP